MENKKLIYIICSIVIAISVGIIGIGVAMYFTQNKDADSASSTTENIVIDTTEDITIKTDENSQNTVINPVVERVANNITFQGEPFKLPFKESDLRSDMVVEKGERAKQGFTLSKVYLNDEILFSTDFKDDTGEALFFHIHINALGLGVGYNENMKDFSFDGIKLGDNIDNVITKFGEPDKRQNFEESDSISLEYGYVESNFIIVEAHSNIIDKISISYLPE